MNCRNQKINFLNLMSLIIQSWLITNLKHIEFNLNIAETTFRELSVHHAHVKNSGNSCVATCLIHRSFKARGSPGLVRRVHMWWPHTFWKQFLCLVLIFQQLRWFYAIFDACNDMKSSTLFQRHALSSSLWSLSPLRHIASKNSPLSSEMQSDLVI